MASKVSCPSLPRLLCLRLHLPAIVSLSLCSSCSSPASGTTFFLPVCTNYTSSILSVPPCQCSSRLPFSSELARTYSFKIKCSEDPEPKSLISYIPWTKSELGAIVKVFPKVTKDPHRSTWFLLLTLAGSYACWGRPGPALDKNHLLGTS